MKITTIKGRLLAGVIAIALVAAPNGQSGKATAGLVAGETIVLPLAPSLEQKVGSGPMLSKLVCIGCGAAVLVGSGTMSIAAVIIALGSVGPEVAAACLYACVDGFDLGGSRL